MRSHLLILAATLGLLLAPSPALPASAGDGLTVRSASVHFGRERDGEVVARLRMEGNLDAGPGLATHHPGGPGLRIALGPLALLDGAAPPRARARHLRSGEWLLAVRGAFGGKGRIRLRMEPGSGTFRLEASGVPATELLAAGPSGVEVSILAGEDARGQTVDFELPRERRWEYRHVLGPRPPPPTGGDGGGGGGGSGLPTLAQGTGSLITSFRFEVCRDAASWQALWTAHAGSGAAPSVDFATTMVVGVWLGTKPGGGVTAEIHQVVPGTVIGAPCTPAGCPPTGAMAGILETQWGPTCGVPMVAGQPFHVVAAPRVEGPVLYEILTRGSDCP